MIWPDGFTVFAGCLKPEGPGADKLRSYGTDRIHIVGYDVTSEEDAKEALAYVKNNIPVKGKLMQQTKQQN